MKKITAIALALVMLLALCACGNSGKEPVPTPPAATPAADTPAPADAANEPATQPDDNPVETAFTTVTDGVLTMATNAQFPPYEFYEGQEIVGIDADILAAIAGKLGLKVQIDDMEFDSIIEAVKNGKADIGLAGITVTPERAEVINFTDSYATGVQVIIVTDDSAITSVDDLFADGANHVVGVQRNTTGDIFASGDIEDAGLGTIDRYSKGADAVQALKTGKVDCVIIDNEPAKAFVAEVDGLKILDTEYVVEDYSAVLSKDNPELYDAVNNAIKELIADGTIKGIIDRYISAD